MSDDEHADRRQRGVTTRVVVLCLALAFLLGYIIPVIDFKLSNTFLGAQHLPPGAVGALFVLVVVVHPLLKLVSKRWALSRNEALTVYISCLFSSLIPGHGAENFIVPNLLAPFYYASPENKYLTMLQPHLQSWLSPALAGGNYQVGTPGYNAVAGWYEGNGGVVPWNLWIVPLAAWMSLVLATYTMFCCLSAMLRAQWSEREALSFPLLRLPLEMTEDMDSGTRSIPPFFRNRLMWTGFGIAVFIQMLRGLHLYFPDVPDFSLEISGNFFQEPPWNQIGWVDWKVFPIVIGLTYLLTTEVSFSLWFFYWLMKFQLIGAYYLGYAPNSLTGFSGAYPGKTFQAFQAVGAYLAYVAFVLWIARFHLRHVARRAFAPHRVLASAGEKTEVMSYPLAFWGFVGSFVFMTAWTVAAGMRLDVALLLWFCYLVLAIGLTRVAVEGGFLFLLHDMMPLSVVYRLFGASAPAWLNNASGVVPSAFVQGGLVFHLRGFIMPSFVHSFKLAHDHKIAAKPLLRLIIAVILISTAMSFLMAVKLGYDHGGLTLGNTWWASSGAKMPVRFLSSLEALGSEASTPNILPWASLGVGGVLTLGMMIARSRFAAFPFHPIGYLMSMAFPITQFWMSIFIGWACKVLITKYGGHDSYRKTVPLFLGLVLGEVAMMLFWLAVDGWFGRTGHQMMPG